MLKKLPETEFEIMKVIWANEAPISSNLIMEHLAEKMEWKARQTAISLLMRLVERGFLRTEKNGKEREYYPIVKKEDYLKLETQNFMKMYHNNSFASFLGTLCSNTDINEKDMEEIVRMVKERGE